MTRCLFIGGSADGEYIDVADPLPPTWRVVERPGPYGPFRPFYDKPSRDTFEAREYVRVRFEDQRYTATVYVCKTIDSPLLALLRGYRKPR